MIIRTAKQRNYSVIDNTILRDPNLSFKARGVAAYLLSQPDDWQINERHLANQSPDGETAIRSGLKELEKAGYLHRRKGQDEQGRFRWEAVLHEHPCVENPRMDKPCVDKQPLLSTIVLNTISDTNVSVLPDAPVTPPLAEVEVTPFQVEDTTPTPPQAPPVSPSPPLAVQFRTLTEELRTAKNKAALLMQIYILCYGVDSAVTFAYLGKVAKQVGGAGYLAQRLWELAVHPPNGDVLAYILAEHKHKAARQKQDAPKLSAASLFEAQEVPDYIRGMQS